MFDIPSVFFFLSSFLFTSILARLGLVSDFLSYMGVFFRPGVVWLVWLGLMGNANM